MPRSRFFPRPPVRLALLRMCGALTSALALGLPSPALATWEANESDDPEMLLIVWDQARETSYALDLGVHVSTLRGDGQSDDGFQRFWTLDPAADPNLQKFLTGASAVNTLQWGVFTSDFNGFKFLPGDLWIYTTLNHTTPTGTVNPEYSSLLSQTNLNLETALTVTKFYSIEIVSNPGPNNGIHNAIDITNYELDGSLFAAKGEVGYALNSAAALIAFQGTGTTGAPQGPSTLNTIGRSSWAYMVTTSGFGDDLELVTVDEFDNLEHDAYWGLAEDPDSGILYLSYTLDAIGLTAAQHEFALGVGRTERDNGFAVRRLDGVAVAAGVESPFGYSRSLGAAVPLPALAPAPEPGTWGLMALGLAGLGALRLRRR